MIAPAFVDTIIEGMLDTTGGENLQLRIGAGPMVVASPRHASFSLRQEAEGLAHKMTNTHFDLVQGYLLHPEVTEHCFGESPMDLLAYDIGRATAGDSGAFHTPRDLGSLGDSLRLAVANHAPLGRVSLRGGRLYSSAWLWQAAA